MVGIKKILFVVIMLFLWIPLLQHRLHFSKERALKGSFTKAEQPTNQKWANGDFQKAYDAYFDSHVGFKSFFTRFYNQIQYSLYNKTTVRDVEIGKEGYLYGGGYIRDYMGYNFIGGNVIAARLKKIKQIQQELEQDGVKLIMAFAPGKASYFPEYLPARHDTSKRTISNYLCYLEQCEKIGINFIDFNALFMELKQQGEDKLFPKGGVHWGQYGATLALQQLVKKIEKEDSINLANISISEVYFPEQLRDEDKDISDAMNLLTKYPSYSMPEPKVQIQHNENETQPKILLMGDSYGYALTNSKAYNELFGKKEFWYYNRTIKPARKNHSSEVADLNVKQELRNFDYVVLLSTETNLYKFDFGFTDSYFRGEEKRLEHEINKVIEKIKNDANWLASVQKSANEKKITLEDALRRNAVYVINNRKKE